MKTKYLNNISEIPSANKTWQAEATFDEKDQIVTHKGHKYCMHSKMHKQLSCPKVALKRILTIAAIAFTFGIILVSKNFKAYKETAFSGKKAYLFAVPVAKKPDSSQKYVLAEGGFNQYQAGGPASCTSLACAFVNAVVKSSEPLTSKELQTLIKENKISGNAFIDIEDALKKFPAIKLATTPKEWTDKLGGFPNIDGEMEADLAGKGFLSLESAVKILLKSNNIQGAVLTANMVTIGMRKLSSESMEFFDPHGANEITNAGNAAYVVRCNSLNEIIDFLNKRFPLIEGLPLQARIVLLNPC